MGINDIFKIFCYYILRNLCSIKLERWSSLGAKTIPFGLRKSFPFIATSTHIKFCSMVRNHKQ